MSRYKINVQTLRGIQLTFTVSEYSITEGDFVEFIDEKTERQKIFHASNCEIEEVYDGK